MVHFQSLFFNRNTYCNMYRRYLYLPTFSGVNDISLMCFARFSMGTGHPQLYVYYIGTCGGVYYIDVIFRSI